MTESKYYAHTSTGSKRAIFTFITTSIVCSFLLDNTAGLFTGAIFVVAGMFIASVAVAMPFYFYKKKHLKMYSFITMIEFLMTIFLTVMFFLYFFTNPFDFSATTSSIDTDSAYIVRCDEPVPEFTLGMDSIPSKVQGDAICSCIWKKLSPSDKNFSASIARNERHDATESQLRQLISRIDVVTESCWTKGL